MKTKQKHMTKPKSEAKQGRIAVKIIMKKKHISQYIYVYMTF